MPSFNQAEFLSQAIESVLDQRYGAKELIVVDGGSSDGSREILARYARHLAYWVSEPDGGQANALNKALRRARGSVIGWQNSDDFYYPEAFEEAVDVMNTTHSDLVFGNLKLVDGSGRVKGELRFTKFNLTTLMYEGTALANQAAFWTRALQSRVGDFCEDLHFCMDLDFFLRAAACGDFAFRRSIWGAFREHAHAKSAMLTGIGSKEHELLLRRWAPHIDQSGFRKAARLLSIARRVIFYLAQGDGPYVRAGLRRRLGGQRS